jgi:hypothetical protein
LILQKTINQQPKPKIMKKYSILKFAGLLILLMTFQLSCAQKVLERPGSPKGPKKLEITMKIDYSKWNDGYRYEAIKFYDDDEDAEKKRGETAGLKDKDSARRGRNFKSNVKRKQKLVWNADFLKEEDREKKIILISVVSNPKNTGKQILTESWFDSKNDGKTIEGSTQTDFETGAEERYLISFAITDGEGKWYSIYTVDPIIRGSDH